MIRNAFTGEPKDPAGPSRQLDAVKRESPQDDGAGPAHMVSDALPTALPMTPPPTLPLWAQADVSIDDWDALLSAVKDRLRQTVGESLTRQLNGGTAPVQASVLECVDALDQLHATLSRELARHAAQRRD